MFERCFANCSRLQLRKLKINRTKMMTNLVPSEEVIIEDTAIEIVEKSWP